MQATKRLLAEVMAGRSVGEDLWMQSQREVGQAKIAMARIPEDGSTVKTTGNTVIVSVPEEDADTDVRRTELIERLGATYILLERMIYTLRTRGALTSIDPNIAEEIMTTRDCLRRLNYEGIAHRIEEPIHYGT